MSALIFADHSMCIYLGKETGFTLENTYLDKDSILRAVDIIIEKISFGVCDYKEWKSSVKKEDMWMSYWVRKNTITFSESSRNSELFLGKQNEKYKGEVIHYLNLIDMFTKRFVK